jgi:hypothetical protein
MIKLTKKDLEEIKDLHQDSDIYQWLTNAKKAKFSIGDVLLKEFYGWNNEDAFDDLEPKWCMELGDEFGLPQRYMYVYEDEQGIGFLKAINPSTGKLEDGLIYLADLPLAFDINNSNSSENMDAVKFSVDSEYADSILLGCEFNAKESYEKMKSKKEKVAVINTSNMIKTRNLSELNKFFSQISVGQTFYVGDDDGECSTFLVRKITKKYISSVSVGVKRDLARIKKDDEKSVYILNSTVDDSYDQDDHCGEFANKGLFLSKPLTMENDVE